MQIPRLAGKPRPQRPWAHSHPATPAIVAKQAACHERAASGAAADEVCEARGDSVAAERPAEQRCAGDVLLEGREQLVVLRRRRGMSGRGLCRPAGAAGQSRARTSRITCTRVRVASAISGRMSAVI